MKQFLIVALLLLAGCATQSPAPARYDALAPAWEPRLTQSLHKMRAAASATANGFLFITAHDAPQDPGYFLQCTYSVEEDVTLCEAAAPEKHPEITPVLRPGFRETLTALGFDTSHADPHYQLLYELDADPTLDKLGGVLLHALVDAYGFGAEGQLIFHVGTVPRGEEGPAP
ncbi:MAG: hypothetical protein P4M00_08680 [Azospirillaceae bacterium]|nr:hypothetical protein [Azospirillaceae bacterium]